MSNNPKETQILILTLVIMVAAPGGIYWSSATWLVPQCTVKTIPSLAKLIGN